MFPCIPYLTKRVIKEHFPSILIVYMVSVFKVQSLGPVICIYLNIYSARMH